MYEGSSQTPTRSQQPAAMRPIPLLNPTGSSLNTIRTIHDTHPSSADWTAFNYVSLP